MDTDIRDEIERSFGGGPPVDDVALLLGRGRRALRRRLIESATGLVVAAVAITGAAVATSGPSEDALSPAGPPSSSASAAEEPAPATAEASRVDGVRIVVDHHLPGSAAIGLGLDGVVRARPGVTVVRAVANPFDRTPPSRSVGIVYVSGGTTYWYVGYLDSAGGGGSAGEPAEDDVSFRDWMNEVSTIQGSGHGPASGGPDPASWPGRVDLQLVRFAGSGEQLAPVDAVTVLEQRPHPDIGVSFASGDDESAVAEVRFEGERWYVLARRTAGSSPQYISVKAADGGATLDDFLDLARERYAEGGGGLL